MISNLNILHKSYNQAFGKMQEPKNNNSISASITTNIPEQKSDEVNLSVLAINDVHGKMTNMERIYSVSKHFDRTVPEGTDTLKLSSGDFILGANFVSNRVANKFLNWIGVSANAVGNHELDVVPAKLAELMNEANYSLLAINATVDESSPMYGKIGKSIIEERNGHKYGIIGIAPSDMTERVKLNDSVKDIKIDDIVKQIASKTNNPTLYWKAIMNEGQKRNKKVDYQKCSGERGWNNFSNLKTTQSLNNHFGIGRK
jgi:2',3'-cyclic-nucleotide 2'-phosphodiesterase (5'-nucleotidase family)